MRLPRHTLDPYADISPVLEVGRPEIEHRFLVDAADADSFIEFVELYLPEQIHDRFNPVNYLVTTYFDTEDRRMFRSGDGAGRGRVRVRQYASAPSSDAPPIIGDVCAFELKESNDASRRKARIVATPEEIDRLIYRDGWLRDSHASAVSTTPLFRAAS